MTLQRILGHETLEMVRNYVTPISSQSRVQHRKYSHIDRMNLGRVKLGRNNHRQGRGEIKTGKS